ncbi:MAG: hypothetical protein IT235_03740 [Bacteroidia bacterium]|nr:hypothetical protein [Bacteroidia bacterium]
MKKLIILLSMVSLPLISSAQSQQAQMQGQTQAQKSAPDPKMQTERMAKRLGLSEDQKAKVLVINTDVDQKLQALKANKSKTAIFVKIERR